MLAALVGGGLGDIGEVYRARDATLHRDVPLKVLPEACTAGPKRLAPTPPFLMSWRSA